MNCSAGSERVEPKLFWRITKKLQEGIANWRQKSYNIVTAESRYGDCEIFFFLLLRYRAQPTPPPAVLLLSCMDAPHRRCLTSCAKKSVLQKTGFFVWFERGRSMTYRDMLHRFHPLTMQSDCFFTAHFAKLCRLDILYSCGKCGIV